MHIGNAVGISRKLCAIQTEILVVQSELGINRDDNGRFKKELETLSDVIKILANVACTIQKDVADQG